MRAIALACVLGFGLCAANAQAQDDVEVLINRALEMRAEGNDEGALALLQRAHEMRPSGRTHGQIGFAQQALGNWREAYRHLSAALSIEEPWVERLHDRLVESQALARARVTLLSVRCNVDGAAVTINEVSVGRTPLPEEVPVAEGPFRLQVSAEGHTAVELNRTSIGGEAMAETVTLVPNRSAEDPPIDSIVDPVEPTTRRSPWTWVTMGVGGAALLGSVLMYGAWWKNANEWEDCYQQRETLEEDAFQGCLDAYDRGTTARTATLILFPIGAALSLTSIILLFTTAPNDERDAGGETGSRLSLTAGPGNVGLGLNWEWND